MHIAFASAFRYPDGGAGATRSLALASGLVALGLGNGPLTKLGACYATGNWRMAQRYVATAYAALTVATGLFLDIFWAILSSLSWHELYPADPDAAERVALVQRIQFAYQHVAQSNLWQLVVCALTISMTYVAVWSDTGPVLAVAAGVIGVPLAGATLHAAVVGPAATIGNRSAVRQSSRPSGNGLDSSRLDDRRGPVAIEDVAPWSERT